MDRRNELLDSAENAARRRGYDGFSYKDIAEDVGIRKASIHYHFPTKSDLAVALLERYSEGFEKTLERIAAKHDTAAARLSDYIQAYRKALGGGHKLCLCVAFAISRDSLSDDALKKLDSFHSNSLTWLKEAFELAKADGTVSLMGDTSAEAAALLGLVEGAQLMARSSRSLVDFDQATSLFRSRLS